MSLTENEAQEVTEIIKENVDLEDIIRKDEEEAVEEVRNVLDEYDLNQSQLDKTENVVRAFAMTPTEEMRKIYDIEGTTPEQREVAKITIEVLMIMAPETVKKVKKIITLVKENFQEIRQAYRDGNQQLKQVINDKL